MTRSGIIVSAFVFCALLMLLSVGFSYRGNIDVGGACMSFAMALIFVSMLLLQVRGQPVTAHMLKRRVFFYIRGRMDFEDGFLLLISREKDSSEIAVVKSSAKKLSQDAIGFQVVPHNKEAGMAPDSKLAFLVTQSDLKVSYVPI